MSSTVLTRKLPTGQQYLITKEPFRHGDSCPECGSEYKMAVCLPYSCAYLVCSDCKYMFTEWSFWKTSKPQRPGWMHCTQPGSTVISGGLMNLPKRKTMKVRNRS